ncbi:hypothetical protein TrVE_jg11021 [Triparma verrucosa]|uniref:Uncharacterized protein n=1 Tax=Triparma verrucosa TaxID=1606542 RepID=A0A9W7KVW6_9STRA|nr:hypothetical protein TrVE_jg11021 [Triparma verrucosa]
MNAHLDSPTTTNVPVDPLSVAPPTFINFNNFLGTSDFFRLFVDFLPLDTLMSMRHLNKSLQKIVQDKLPSFVDDPKGIWLIHADPISFTGDDVFWGCDKLVNPESYLSS